MLVPHRGSAGYCFVELADEASVDRCVQRLNGKLVPGSNPVSDQLNAHDNIIVNSISMI